MDEQEPDSIYAVDLPKVKAVCLILSHRAAGGVFCGVSPRAVCRAGLAVLAFAWWYAVCKTPQVKQVGQEEQGITLSVPKLVLLFALPLAVVVPFQTAVSYTHLTLPTNSLV